MRSREASFFLLVAVGLPMVFGLGCHPESTPPLPPPGLSSPEMPGDRVQWMMEWQRRDCPHFVRHYLTFESDGLSPLETLEKLFKKAETPRGYGDQKVIASPTIEVSDALRQSQAGQSCSVSFGVNHRNYPRVSVAEIVAHICLDHGIALKEVSEDRYGLDEAPDSPDFTEAPAFVRGKAAGLELNVEIPKEGMGQWLVTMTNRGDKKVVVGHPESSGFHPGKNPQIVWSVLPADEKPLLNHPSSRSIDRTIPGCGTGWFSYSGRVLELAPGETVDIGNRVGEPWEARSREASGRFRARLFFRNNPNVPFSSQHGFSESKKARIETSNAKTFDCLVVSNEIVFEANERAIRLHKEWEAHKKAQLEAAGN